MSGSMPAAAPRGWRALAAILFAVFVVALGYGAILPVLPLMVERLLGSSEPAMIARHTALLTGAFAIAPLAAAFPWGRLSDRYGRRPILVANLVGFAVTLAASVLPLGLPFLYIARLLNGGFASGVLPSALAFVAGELQERGLIPAIRRDRGGARGDPGRAHAAKDTLAPLALSTHDGALSRANTP